MKWEGDENLEILLLPTEQEKGEDMMKKERIIMDDIPSSSSCKNLIMTFEYGHYSHRFKNNQNFLELIKLKVENVDIVAVDSRLRLLQKELTRAFWFQFYLPCILLKLLCIFSIVLVPIHVLLYMCLYGILMVYIPGFDPPAVLNIFAFAFILIGGSIGPIIFAVVVHSFSSKELKRRENLFLQSMKPKLDYFASTECQGYISLSLSLKTKIICYTKAERTRYGKGFASYITLYYPLIECHGRI